MPFPEVPVPVVPDVPVVPEELLPVPTEPVVPLVPVVPAAPAAPVPDPVVPLEVVPGVLPRAVSVVEFMLELSLYVLAESVVTDELDPLTDPAESIDPPVPLELLFALSPHATIPRATDNTNESFFINIIV